LFFILASCSVCLQGKSASTQAYHQIAKTPMIALEAESG